MPRVFAYVRGCVITHVCCVSAVVSSCEVCTDDESRESVSRSHFSLTKYIVSHRHVDFCGFYVLLFIEIGTENAPGVDPDHHLYTERAPCRSPERELRSRRRDACTSGCMGPCQPIQPLSRHRDGENGRRRCTHATIPGR